MSGPMMRDMVISHPFLLCAVYCERVYFRREGYQRPLLTETNCLLKALVAGVSIVLCPGLELKNENGIGISVYAKNMHHCRTMAVMLKSNHAGIIITNFEFPIT